MSRHPLPLALVVSSLLAACGADSPADTARSNATDAGATDGSGVIPDVDGSGEAVQQPLRPAAAPTEYVAFTVRLPIEDGDVRSVLAPVFGLPEAGFHTNFQLQDGILLTSATDARTPEQVVITVGMETSTGDEPALRTVARVPASVAYGALFVDAVEAAVAQAAAVTAAGDTMEAFRLEYRTRSANGGNLTIALDSTGAAHQVVVTASSPRTSLRSETMNQAALTGAPYESVYGLVTFSLQRSEFAFFVDRAYGISQGAAQNFKDFYLIPHNWLRLTVTPQLDDERVNVAFDVVTVDGRRIPVANAPASLNGGEQFKQTVFRLIDTMLAAEEAQPGSSTPFEAPYYYDDPQGGGVVEVIARGEAGQFRIAYAVESPVNELLDTEFVPWQGNVVVPPDWDQVDPTCSEIGSEPAAQGFFTMTFEASSTIREITDADGEYEGPVWGSIFRAEDVIITGPLPGTEAVASFYYPSIDLRNGPSQALRIDTQLPAGNYQILGFMDIDDNADPDAPDPDPGDPVMIPIGGFTLECAEQPIVAEFAILRP